MHLTCNKLTSNTVRINLKALLPLGNLEMHMSVITPGKQFVNLYTNVNLRRCHLVHESNSLVLSNRTQAKRFTYSAGLFTAKYY